MTTLFFDCILISTIYRKTLPPRLFAYVKPYVGKMTEMAVSRLIIPTAILTAIVTMSVPFDELKNLKKTHVSHKHLGHAENNGQKQQRVFPR